MTREEIESFVMSRLGGMPSANAYDIVFIANELHDEIAKQKVSAFVDQLQADGWDKRDVSSNTKIWGPDDTYESVEFQVFQGPGKYQVFVRPKPGEEHAEKHLDVSGICV